MKKLILIFLFLISMSCGPSYHMTRDFDQYYMMSQVDSICRIEKIPTRLEKWSKMIASDDSTYFYQYMFIQSTDSTQTIWVLTDLDSLYRFKKKTLKITK